MPSRHIVFGIIRLGAYLILAGFFAYAFYDRYWKWRDCIAQVMSSCTEDGAYNATAGGAVWALPAVVFFVLAVRLAWKMRSGS